jgi:hypothetical protein
LLSQFAGANRPSFKGQWHTSNPLTTGILHFRHTQFLQLSLGLPI